MELVKIITDDDGEIQDNPKWHLVKYDGDAQRTVCTGDVFGFGEGSAIFKQKQSNKGGIACENCLSIIKWYKSIKL